MRGIPGSGKSYYAKLMAHECDGVIFSADQYFELGGQGYKFDPTKIGAAHQYCFNRFIAAARKDPDRHIFVDNTNVHLWEISPYVLAGAAAGHEAELVHVHCDVERAIARNTHGVPEAVIRRMHHEFEAPLLFWKQRVVEN